MPQQTPGRRGSREVRCSRGTRLLSHHIAPRGQVVVEAAGIVGELNTWCCVGARQRVRATVDTTRWLHFSAPDIGGGVRGDGGGLDAGCCIEACRGVRHMDWSPAKTHQVLVLFAHGWMRESVVAHVWRAGEVSPETTLEQLGSVSGIAKNPNGARGSGAHASTARHMAFCMQHWWSTDAEVGYKWPCHQRRCWRVEQKVLFWSVAKCCEHGLRNVGN